MTSSIRVRRLAPAAALSGLLAGTPGRSACIPRSPGPPTTPRPGRSSAIYLAGLLLVALALRFGVLARSNWLLDGDDALSALMAFAILEGDRPIMLKNQAYAGAWEPYAMAASYALFGPSRVAAKLPVLAASLGFVIATWLLAREVAGPSGARFAAALVAAPPIYILVLGLKPWAPYIEVTLLGTLAAWCAVRLAFPRGRRRDGLWAVGCGVTGGLAIWMHPLAVEYLLPAAALLLLRLRGRRLARVVPLGLAGFFVAASPVWIYNLQTSGASVQFILMGTRQTAEHLDVLVGWWTTDLPKGAGLWQPWASSPRDLGVVMAVLLIAAAGWALLVPRPPGRRIGPTDMALLLLAMIPLVATLSGFGSLVVNPWGFDATGRYTLPIWGSLSLLLGGFCATVARWRRAAGLALAGTALAINLFGWLVTDPVQAFQSPYWRKLPAEHGQLLATLETEGVAHVWMNHWAGFPVMFDARSTGRPLIAYDWYDVRAGGIDRFPEHLTLVEQAERTAFVLVTDEPEPELERRLRELGVASRTHRLPPYVVVIPESRRVHPSEVTDALDYRY